MCTWIEAEVADKESGARFPDLHSFESFPRAKLEAAEPWSLDLHEPPPIPLTPSDLK
jgi:hypothetical protein